MSSPVHQSKWPQLDDFSADDVLGGFFGVDTRSELDQSMPAIVFDPDDDGCVMSSQIPVVFTGLSESAKDSVVEDDAELWALWSTENADSPVESEEETACFDLVSLSDEGEPIPASQLRYNVKEMWW